jgi:hypothetical protein
MTFASSMAVAIAAIVATDVPERAPFYLVNDQLMVFRANSGRRHPDTFESKKLPFQGIELLGSEESVTWFFGRTSVRGAVQLGVWKSGKDGSWQQVWPVPNDTISVFLLANADGFGRTGCDSTRCTISIHDSTGAQRKVVPIEGRLSKYDHTPPAVIPDEGTIVLGTEDHNIFRVDLESGSAEKIAFGSFPALSPDGRRLALYRDDGIHTIELATGHDTPLQFQKRRGAAVRPTFSWSFEPTRLFVNYGSGSWFDDGYTCVEVDVESGLSRVVWERKPSPCEGSIVVRP